MKRTILALSIPYLLSAHTLGDLFEALKLHSQTKSDEMIVKMSEIKSSQVTSTLYPKVNLFGSYDNYSTPTGILPVPPNDIVKMVNNNSIAQPFSENIYRAGVKFSMPIFVKSIFTYAKKAEAMHKSAMAKKYINLLKNEALIVGSNANLKYLIEFENSLLAKKKSLLETKKTLKIKVENGRSPASALYKIDDSLNQINISKNNIALQKNRIISSIEAITGIKLQKAVEMKAFNSYSENSFESLKPIKEKIEANKLDIKAQKEKLYPSVSAYGSYVFSKADAYNNGKNVDETYGNVGILINIPLLEMSQYEEIKKAKMQVKSSEIELQKLTDELNSQATMLKESLPLYDNSILLSQKSVENKMKLLNIAKVNYKSTRLSTEEYLRYEDDVLNAKVKLYQAKAQKWQTLMELAVIYANNIEEMVK